MPTIQITADKDGFIAMSSPSSTMASYSGHTSTLQTVSDVGNGHAYQTSERDSLLGFPGSVPAGAVVTAVTLRLFFRSGPLNGGMGVSPVADWDPNVVTWNSYTHRTGDVPSGNYQNMHQPQVTNGGPGANDTWWTIALPTSWVAAATRTSLIVFGNPPGNAGKGTISDNSFDSLEASPAGAVPLNPPNLIVTYNRPPPTPGVFTSPAAGAVFNTVHNVTFGASVDPDGDAVTYRLELSLDNGATWPHVLATAATLVNTNYDFTSYAATAAAKLRVRSSDGTATSAWRESSVFTIQHNLAPTPATPLSPISNSPIDRTITQRFSWTFNDPDAGDAKSKHDFRYRLVGAGAWTTILNQVNVNNYHDLAGGTLAAGDYEWQVLTYDNGGLPASGWSASAFFKAVDPPAAVVITAPVSGSTVPAANSLVAWNAPDQTDFQVQRVADAAGVINPAVIYYDSGEVNNAAARNHALTFETNNRWEWIRVRRKYAGVWSPWAQVRVNISYTPPAIPGVNVDTESANGRIRVIIDNPVPGGTEPAVTANWIFRRVQGQDDLAWQRLSTTVANDGTFDDYTAADGLLYEYLVRAVGANGTYRDAGVAYDVPLALRGSWLHAVSDPAGTIYRFRYNGAGGVENWTPELTLTQYAGRVNEVAEYGEHETFTASAAVQLDGQDEVDVAREFARLKTILCYRDGSGRRLFGVIPAQSIGSTGYGGTTSLDITQIDFSEVV